MTMRYKSTYGEFESLSVTVSDFLSIISFEDKVKNRQQLYSVKKRKTTKQNKTLKTPVGRIRIFLFFFFLSEIYFWILAKQNANNISDLLMRRPLVTTYASLWPVGAYLQPPIGLRQRQQLVYPEQLPREQPAFYDIMVGLRGNRLACNNARRRLAAWKITMINQFSFKTCTQQQKIQTNAFDHENNSFFNKSTVESSLKHKSQLLLLLFLFFKAVRIPCYFVLFRDIILNPDLHYFNQHQPERKQGCRSALITNLYLAL